MPQYILRDLPADLWSQFSERATAEGWPKRALLLQLIRDYVAGTVVPSEKPPTVALPFDCPHCKRPLTVLVKYKQGLQVGDGWHRFPCPACGEPIHRELPSEFLDVQPRT